jgi:hypothetical protein
MIVVRAAADIARHCRPDFLSGWMCIAREQTFGAHELPRSAEPALRSVMVYERLLKRIKVLTIREAFDRPHFSSVGPYREIAARVDWLAIQQDRAGSAFAPVAANLRARQPEVIAQQFRQSPTIFHLKSMLSAIHQQSNSRAGHPQGSGFRQVRGGQRPLERRRYCCRNDSRASALDKLSAGNVVFAFAHMTYPER